MKSEELLQHDRDALLAAVVDAAQEYEFRTYVIGVERPRNYDRQIHERAFRQLKIDLGSRLERLWPDRVVDFEKPEVRFDVRARRGIQVAPRSSPLFIGGRYLKHSREIPACRWMCMPCRGRGCRECHGTGNVYGPSIQELIQPLFLQATGGEALFFHGAGREDVDVRMLGTGRPFVLEVRQPRKRQLDLPALEEAANEQAAGRAEVRRLAFATRQQMVAAKAAHAEKTYRARVAFDESPSVGVEQRIEKLRGQEIAQLSPTRVMQRRGENTVRRKQVLDCRVIDRDGDDLVCEIRSSSGTYIKELISGDGGRTRPSLAELAGIPCHCAELDVVAIHWHPPWEAR